MTQEPNLFSIISEQADRQFRDLLTPEALHSSSVGQWLPGLWDSVEESGLSLALVAEEHGGAGLPPADALEIVRLSGYRALPVPLGETMLARALWSAAGGLTDALEGKPVFLAMPSQLSLRPHGNGGAILNGRVGPVAMPTQDACLLTVAPTPEGTQMLLLLETGSATPLHRHTSPAFEPRFHLEWSECPLRAEQMLPWSAHSALALQAQGALVRSMEMTGAMRRALEWGLQYAGERAQFGKPIARFAPVQDMLVEAAAETAAAISAAGLAAEKWRVQLDDDALFCIAAAKSRCGEAAGRVSEWIHQVHGAIGFTQEHALHHVTRRLWAWRDDFGSETFWNQWLGARVAGHGPQLWHRLAAL
jgi:acyl-CoA dehydrogenase